MHTQTYTHSYLHTYIHTYVTRPAKIDHVSAKNRRFLACLLNHNLITLYNCNKIFITTAEFNGLSSAAYRNGIVHSEQKILAKI